MRRSTAATLGILLVTAIWGSTFFVIKDAVSLMDPIDFLAVRFAIGALLPSILFLGRLRRLSAGQWLIGLSLGAIYGFAQIAQTVGLRHTDASVSGFITGTYVVLTPLILWVGFRARLHAATWVAVGLAALGLAVLSLSGLSGGGVGELLTLLGATLYALHIVFLDRWSRSMDAMSLATTQLIGVAVVVGALGLPGGYQLPGSGPVWAAILYTAVVAGIVTMLMQTWAQRHVTPTRVVLLMTFEPVFASVFAIWLGGESVTWRLVLGGSLVLAATLIGVRGGGADRASSSRKTGPDRHEPQVQPPTTPQLSHQGR